MCRRVTQPIGIAMMLAVVLAGTLCGFGSAEESRIRGLIVGRTGDSLAVKAGEGNITVVLTDSTKAKSQKDWDCGRLR